MKMSLLEATPRLITDPKKGALRLLAQLPITSFKLKKQAFNEFTNKLTNREINQRYLDEILFNFSKSTNSRELVIMKRIYPDFIDINLDELEGEVNTGKNIRVALDNLGACMGYLTTENGDYMSGLQKSGAIIILKPPMLYMNKEDEMVIYSIISHEIQHGIDSLLRNDLEYHEPKSPDNSQLNKVQYNKYFFSVKEARARAQEIRSVLRASNTYREARKIVKSSYAGHNQLYIDTALHFLKILHTISGDQGGLTQPILTIGEKIVDAEQVVDSIMRMIESLRSSNIFKLQQTTSPQKRLLAASLERGRRPL